MSAISFFAVINRDWRSDADYYLLEFGNEALKLQAELLAESSLDQVSTSGRGPEADCV